MELFFPFPLSNREAIVYGFGANRIKKNGSIICVAKSVDVINEPLLREKIGAVEDKRRKKNLVEMKIHYYGF